MGGVFRGRIVLRDAGRGSTRQSIAVSACHRGCRGNRARYAGFRGNTESGGDVADTVLDEDFVDPAFHISTPL